jgi:hypothetical protein
MHHVLAATWHLGFQIRAKHLSSTSIHLLQLLYIKVHSEPDFDPNMWLSSIVPADTEANYNEGRRRSIPNFAPNFFFFSMTTRVIIIIANSFHVTTIPKISYIEKVP